MRHVLVVVCALSVLFMVQCREPGQGKLPPLHRAVLLHDTAKVEELLQGGADIDAVVEGDSSCHTINMATVTPGDTAVLLATQIGDEALVKLLTKHGANLSAPNQRGRAPLHEAILNDNARLVQILIEEGADVNVGTGKNYYITGPDTEDHRKAVRKSMGQTPLMHAAAFGSVKILEVLLANGADIHAHRKGGGTALHAATSTGEVECLKLLIEAGGDVQAVDEDKLTLLHIAADAEATYDSQEQREAVIELLLRNDAEIDAQDVDGRTPLHHAVLSDNVDTARLLIDSGASTRILDIEGNTPTELASQQSRAEALEALFEQL